jgi:AcrR family transcriptional regulator
MPVVSSQMRAKLAKSAFKLFAKRGIKNVNLDEIAADAGVTKGSLYWHYKSKKEVILAACAFYYRRWQHRAHAEIARDNDPLKQLERVLRFGTESCLFDRENRVFTTEIFALGLQDADIQASWAQFYDTSRELLVGLVEAAQAQGPIQVVDPRRAVDWLLVAIEGLKQRAAFEPEICTPAELDATVRGLLRIVAHASGEAAVRR